MKIGVITTQSASKYGAILQTFALQKCLNENLKQNSEVLAYYPSHYKGYWKILPRINGVKSAILYGLCCITPRSGIGTRKNIYSNPKMDL